MIGLYNSDHCIVFENTYAKFTMNALGKVESVWDKQSGREMRGEKTDCFALFAKDGGSIPVTNVALRDHTLEIVCPSGTFALSVTAQDAYFVFELCTPLPAGVEYAVLCNVAYNYDYTNKANVGAAIVALSVQVNPVDFPDGKSLQTQALVYSCLGDVGAKFALVAAPLQMFCSVLKTVCAGIDKNEGLVNKIGGPWGRDSRLNFGNYMIQWDLSNPFIEENMPLFKQMGVDQIDFHQGVGSFRQGDFKFHHFQDAAHLKETAVKRLEEEGISAGLHTYSFYIDYACDAIMSDPASQKDLSILRSFTLREDVSATDTFFPTVEATDDLSDDYGFMSRNTQYMLVDTEIVKFIIASGGIQIAERGVLGTTAVAHKQGSIIKHLDGYYHGFAPIPGSDLFFQIARNTAKTFNEGGFKMIYLDALDGIQKHVDKRFNWYYAALFVKEVLRYCDRDPLIEFSMYPPALWAARGRVGAWDTAYRSYKEWNRLHADANKSFIDRCTAATMGWYNFYPHDGKISR